MSSCGGDGASSVTGRCNASWAGALATLATPESAWPCRCWYMQPRWRQQTDNGRLVCAEGSSRGQRNFSFCFGFMVRWCIFQREAVYVYSLEDIDFFPFFPSSFSFLNRGQFPTVHSLLCTHSLFFIHLTCWHIWQHAAVLSSTNPQLYTLHNNAGPPRLLHPFSFSFRKLIINGQFENRLESPQGCLPCQIEKGQGQVSRLSHCPLSWCFRGGCTGGNITNSPHAASKAMAKDGAREGGVAASWGSLTSSPQHLYHKSPQRLYGSLQWAGVGSIR